MRGTGILIVTLNVEDRSLVRLQESAILFCILEMFRWR